MTEFSKHRHLAVSALETSRPFRFERRKPLMSSQRFPDEDPAATDATLLRRLKSGEGDAATELYLRYARRLHGLARRQTSSELSRRVDPDEIVQSVFRTFFRRAAGGSYDIPPSEELWRLLLVITLNKIRRASVFHRAARRDVRRTVSTGDDNILQHLEQVSFQDDAALHVLRLVVDELIAGLPAPQDAMVRLRIDGHEVEEIASMTQRSKRTVERTLQKFREKISRILEQEELGEPD